MGAEEKGFEQWLAEAESGDDRAMLTVGIYYIFGEGVVEPDFSKAEKWLERAADLNNADAMLALAIAYDEEELGHCDKVLAYSYFKRAADLGNVDALYKVAQALLTGTGVPADTKEGLRLMHQAADLGSADAFEALHQMHHHGPGCDCGDHNN
ncbi:MAG: sel1 repeat family protein [Opitutales bacterium]|nr:sel1 repeat family protein [Opitutales bacterium]